MAAPAEVLHREMGCTRAEFMRWLPGATRGAPCTIDGDCIELTLPRGAVRIVLDVRPPRRIGELAVPVLAVEIAFVGVEADTRARFLDHLDLYMRRGGG